MEVLIKNILSRENETTEYKSNFNIQVIESLTAFANTKDGRVYIGVSDSYQRNKLIANIFKELGWIEKYGSGIRRVIKYFKKEGLLQPKFKEMANGFLAIVHSNMNLRINRTVEETDRTVEEIISAIKIDPNITQNQLMKKTGLSRRGIEWNLNKLKNQGRLRRIGSTKGGYWELVE